MNWIGQDQHHNDEDCFPSKKIWECNALVYFLLLISFAAYIFPARNSENIEKGTVLRTLHCICTVYIHI